MRFPTRSTMLLVGVLTVFAAQCTSARTDDTAEPRVTTPTAAPTSTVPPPPPPPPPSTSTTTATSTTEPGVETVPRPAWLGTRDLTPPGAEPGTPIIGLSTPPELLDRRFATIDLLPAPPPDAPFTATVEPLDGERLEASTWHEGCPVAAADLRVLTMSFWGFDDRPHTGELVVHASVADDVVAVFAQLFDARFPIEEMRNITDADLVAPPTGDGNVTAGFVCRAVRGGSRFSEHASGLAIDVNPFLNPYRRGDHVLPELAGHYLDRSLAAPGQIQPDDVVVTAFADIGWEWGGDWTSLKDYQHFALNDR